MIFDILMLSKLVPKEISNETKAKVKNLMDEASFAWQYHLIEGLETSGANIQLVNIMPVSTYPNGFASPFVKREMFSHNGIAEDVNVPICNIKFLKRIFLYGSLKKEVKRWAKKKSENQKVLIVYTLYPEYLKIVNYIKNKYKDIVVLGIVLDLPEFTVLQNYRQNLLNKIYRNYNAKLVKNNINKIDGLIPITNQIVGFLNFRNKYAVIEGIATSSFPSASSNNENKIIIYAGMLHEKFGLIKLLDAFDLIKDEDIRLVICGVGEADKEIVKRAARDSRIDFKGQLPREKVLEIISNADIIVNPRFKKEEYTKYSFPSKNIEALSSGVPFIGYKLEGIPDEYDSFINYPKDYTDEALASLITDICSDNSNIYRNKAKLAQDWIVSNKNKVAQGKKVLDLITEILLENGKRNS